MPKFDDSKFLKPAGEIAAFAILFYSFVGICFWPNDALLNRLCTSVPSVNYLNTATRWTHPVKRPCYNEYPTYFYSQHSFFKYNF